MPPPGTEGQTARVERPLHLGRRVKKSRIGLILVSMALRTFVPASLKILRGPRLWAMGSSLSHGRSLDVGQVGIDRPDLGSWQDGPIDLRGWFGQVGDAGADRPLELEIGSGKGTFLVQAAIHSPEADFIGLEYAKTYWRFAADRCCRRRIENVRIVHAEATFFLRYFVPDATFRQIHIYYPDPWPKKRHHKRRLIQPDLLNQLYRILAAGGSVRIATDHEDYFQWINQKVKQVAELFEPQPFDSPASADPAERVGTNFERKYRQQQRPFFGLILCKRF